MNEVQVEIVTPGRKVYEGKVRMVIAKGVEGELGVQYGHIPLVTPLQIAPLRIQLADGQQHFAVSGGFLEVRRDKVTVLAETAEAAADIDVDRAKSARQRAEQNLEGLDSKDPQYKKYTADLNRAKVRLKVAESVATNVRR
jgi:F-type H+-transporting ATPase subunit epsilon